MTELTEWRLTVDEISIDRDGRRIATLVEPGGGIVTIPETLLPEGANVNQVIVASFRLDPQSTRDRIQRVQQLQHRLFNRNSRSQ